MTTSRIPSNNKTIWFLFWAYSLLIVKGAVMAADDFPGFFANLNDKVVHGAEYFFLQALAWAAFKNSLKVWLRERPLGMAFGYCLIMGVLTECLQIGSRTRSASVGDFAADAFGAALMLVWIYFFQKRKTA